MTQDSNWSTLAQEHPRLWHTAAAFEHGDDISSSINCVPLFLACCCFVDKEKERRKLGGSWAPCSCFPAFFCWDVDRCLGLGREYDLRPAVAEVRVLDDTIACGKLPDMAGCLYASCCTSFVGRPSLAKGRGAELLFAVLRRTSF